MKKQFHALFLCLSFLLSPIWMPVFTGAIVGAGCSGCSTLAPEGVYGSDKLLYETDKLIVDSYQIFDAFLRLEKENRDALFKVSPEIKKTADKIRADGPKWISSAIAMRDAYKSQPGTDTKTALETALGVLRTGVAEAIRWTIESKKA